MTHPDEHLLRWGEPPWRVDFLPPARMPGKEVDFAIIGGGFTGLAAACQLRRLAPQKTVALLESRRLGSGASGRTGGIALAGTAYGDLPGSGDVLQGFVTFLQELEINSQLMLDGVWEVGRNRGHPKSPIRWEDSGALQVVREVAGGTVDAGGLVSGLASAAERLGVALCENAPVLSVSCERPAKLALPRSELLAHQMLYATNGYALDLSGLAGHAESEFTLAVATEPLRGDQLQALGLGQRKAFYTIDLPYLWGRVLPSAGVVFGSGLVPFDYQRELGSIDIRSGQPAQLLKQLEQRVRRLHPALDSVKFTHRWGGPILFPRAGSPFFAPHARCPHGLVVAGYSGHGVALSVYLGRWAAEVLLGRRELPPWGFKTS